MRPLRLTKAPQAPTRGRRARKGRWATHEGCHDREIRELRDPPPVPDHFLGFDLTENRRARPCSDRAVPSAARARLARPVGERPHEHTVVAQLPGTARAIAPARPRPTPEECRRVRSAALVSRSRQYLCPGTSSASAQAHPHDARLSCHGICGPPAVRRPRTGAPAHAQSCQLASEYIHDSGRPRARITTGIARQRITAE
jgi:hypothetical protein